MSNELDPRGRIPITLDGKPAFREPEIKDTDKDEFCNRSIKERIVAGHINRVKPCAICKGTEVNDWDGMLRIVNDLKQGLRPPECESCWNDEDQGFKSFRQYGNEFWTTPGNGNSHTEITYSNECDAACIYCGPVFSSRWVKEIEESPEDKELFYRFGHQDNDPPNPEDARKTAQHIVKELALDHNKYACTGVYGGEPTLSIIENDDVGGIINTFFKYNKMENRRIRYDINSNMNYTEERCNDIIEYVDVYAKKYKTVDFIIQPSLESIDDLYEFIRYGCSWERMDRNIDKWLSETPYTMEIKSAINNVSLVGLKDFIHYMNHKSKHHRPLEIKIDWVMHDIIFNLGILDSSFKRYVDETLDYINNNTMYFTNTESIVANLNKTYDYIGMYPHGVRVETAKRALQLYDYFKRKRKVDIKDINPELYNYLLNISTK